MYLAAQDANPFGSLARDVPDGRRPRLGQHDQAGRGSAALRSRGAGDRRYVLSGVGQIVTTFKNTPDLPFEELQLHFFGGERAPLSTPSRCGTYTTHGVVHAVGRQRAGNSVLELPDRTRPGRWPLSRCEPAIQPVVTGGATNIQAGAFSPFTLTMNRKDGEQNLQSVEAHLPAGCVGGPGEHRTVPRTAGEPRGVRPEQPDRRNDDQRRCRQSAVHGQRAGSSISPAPTTAPAPAPSAKRGARRSA